MMRIEDFAKAILSLSLSLAILSPFTIGIPPEVNMMRIEDFAKAILLLSLSLSLAILSLSPFTIGIRK